METEKALYTRVFSSMLFPILMLALIWLVKLYEIGFDTSLTGYGLWPRELRGIPGIFTMPFLHANGDNLKHITNNSTAFFVLGTLVFFFYREMAFKVFLWIYLIGGFWLWVGAPAGVPHIGASGVIYGLASFVFFSGFIRRHLRLMAVSLLVVTLYGSFVWGIFPIDIKISWQGHLFGGIAGAICAWMFRKEGIQRKLYSWELEEQNGQESIDRVGDAWMIRPPEQKQPQEQQPTGNKPDTSVKITYIYKTKPPKEENGKNQE